MRTLVKMQTAFAVGVVACLASSSVIARGDDIHGALISDEAHNINAFEIELAKLAMRQGSTGAVRDFGSRLLKDHEDSDHAILMASRNDHLKLEIRPFSAEERSILRRLADIDRDRFDDAFLDRVKLDQQTAIVRVNQEIERLEPSQTRTALSALVATLHDNAETAIQLAAQRSATRRLPASAARPSDSD